MWPAPPGEWVHWRERSGEHRQVDPTRGRCLRGPMVRSPTKTNDRVANLRDEAKSDFDRAVGESDLHTAHVDLVGPP